MYSLISFLRKVKDWRKSNGQRHPLWWILLIVILSLMAGCLSDQNLAAFGKNYDYSLMAITQTSKD